MANQRVFDIRGVNDARQGMWRGLRPYGVALTVIWTAASVSVLAVFAVAEAGLWLHIAFAVGAVLELCLCVLTLRFLVRASNAGRFNT
jgi:hypothetical protein